MKKVIIGLVAVAAMIGLLPVIKRKAHNVREHCEQMAAKCKRMTAQSGAGAEAAGMHEHPEQMTAQHDETMDQFGVRAAEATAREHSEATAAQVGGRSEALSTA